MIPSWTGTPLDQPITKIALPLIACKGDNFYPSGTACVIAPWLALTASHVVADHYRHFHGTQHQAGITRTDFHILTYVPLREGKAAASIEVRQVWGIEGCDIAVLHLGPAGEWDYLNFVWHLPTLDLLPPREGSIVSAFGYPKSTFELTGGNRGCVHMDATTSTGTVIEVHHQRRDRFMLRFPCFQTNSKFVGGMSGGPVLNANGNVCGLVCSSMPPESESEEYTSHVSTLWPSLIISIDAPWDRYPAGTKYPLYEYAAAGIIQANGLERVTVTKAGDITSLDCHGGYCT